jgi:uncharacterized protein (DUF433 family)
MVSWDSWRQLLIATWSTPPGVCQGKTVIEGTRIGVHDLVGLMINGASIDDVCRSFPDLSRAQVYECLAYYEDHRTEIDAFIAEQMSD